MQQGPVNSQGFRSGEGIDLHWRFLPECAGRGYFVLGDAAARLDPSSSHGVMRALMSGIFATHLVTAVEGKSIEPCGAALIYRDWMRAQFTHDTAALHELWNRHPSEAVRREMADSSNELLRNR
jgi:flavin-dependent dehydrogenase